MTNDQAIRDWQGWTRYQPPRSCAPYDVMDDEADEAAVNDLQRECDSCGSTKGEHHASTLNCPVYDLTRTNQSGEFLLLGFGDLRFTPAPPPPPLVEAVESGKPDARTERRLDELRRSDPRQVMTLQERGPNADGDFLVQLLNPDGSVNAELVVNENGHKHEVRTVLPALWNYYQEWADNRGTGMQIW